MREMQIGSLVCTRHEEATPGQVGLWMVVSILQEPEKRKPRQVEFETALALDRLAHVEDALVDKERALQDAKHADIKIPLGISERILITFGEQTFCKNEEVWMTSEGDTVTDTYLVALLEHLWSNEAAKETFGLDQIIKDRDNLREALAWVANEMWASWGVDGGDWQEAMAKMGIIVPVEPDEQFIKDYGPEEGPMYVLAWSERAREG